MYSHGGTASLGTLRFVGGKTSNPTAPTLGAGQRGMMQSYADMESN